jgi:hypothetical protein
MPFREIVGAIQYLVSGTRPDIAHAKRFLGQFNSCFEWSHFQKAKRVLRYLKAGQHYGLPVKISRDGPARVDVFTDADYANDESDRKSVSGYVSQIDGYSIAYASKKLEITAISTSEAEYVAMHEGARDIVWVCKLLDELKLEYVRPPRSGATIKFKHVDVKYHFTRDLVDKRMLIEHCSTHTMPADIFTKPLDRVKFERFREMLRVVKRPSWLSPC